MRGYRHTLSILRFTLQEQRIGNCRRNAHESCELRSFRSKLRQNSFESEEFSFRRQAA